MLRQSPSKGTRNLTDIGTESENGANSPTTMENQKGLVGQRSETSSYAESTRATGGA